MIDESKASNLLKIKLNAPSYQPPAPCAFRRSAQPEVLSYHDFLFGQAQNQYIKLIQIPKLGEMLEFSRTTTSTRTRTTSQLRYLELIKRDPFSKLPAYSA